jgi:hypothetical protein
MTQAADEPIASIAGRPSMCGCRPKALLQKGQAAPAALAATAALASAFLPMAATAQTLQNANVAPTHTFALRQCVTGDQLRAAGQNPVVMAEKMVPTATNRPLIVYSANTQAIGYELVADRPVRMLNNGQFTQPERPACYNVNALLENVRLNDVSTGRVRRDFYQPIANSNLNNSIDAGLRNGVIPVLQATVLVEGRRGPLVTVFSSGTNGSVMRASATGVTAGTDTLRAPSYTQYSASYFPSGTQVAAPSPSGN